MMKYDAASFVDPSGMQKRRAGVCDKQAFHIPRYAEPWGLKYLSDGLTSGPEQEKARKELARDNPYRVHGYGRVYYGEMGFMTRPDLKVVSPVGADPDVKIEGLTFLMWAAICGDGINIKGHIYAGATVDARNESGETALMLAIAYQGFCDANRVLIVEELIHAGASVDVKDRRGRTALLFAVYILGFSLEHRTQVVSFLLKRSGDDTIQKVYEFVAKQKKDKARNQVHESIAELVNDEWSARFSTFSKLSAMFCTLNTGSSPTSSQVADNPTHEVWHRQVVDP
ncbi:hypothetical protein CYMTET_35123, partial [Cymbomonas tetramitiformis]